MLAYKGVKILFTDAPLTGTIDEHWVRQPPRGWHNATDWSGTGGAYDPINKQVIVSMLERNRGESVILHEYGHAIGDILGLNGDKNMATAHKRLYGKLDSYFQQGGPGGAAGIQEFVAESFSDFMRLPREHFIKKYDLELHTLLQTKISGFMQQSNQGENFLVVGIRGFFEQFNRRTGTIGSLLGAGLILGTVGTINSQEN